MYQVLITDDEQLIREGLLRSIPWKELGFSAVGTAASASQAISFFENTTIDLLLTDIHMPGQSGLDLFEWVKTNSPTTKVIVISGYDRFDYACGALRLGASDYILKPVKKKQVIETVKKIKLNLDEQHLKINEENRFEKSYFFMKLLENTFESSEELNEIKMRLEISDEEVRKPFIVTIFDFFENKEMKAKLAPLLNKYHFDDEGMYTIILVPEELIDSFMLEASSIGVPWARGSSQIFDSICISYEKAQERLHHKKDLPIHAFRASFTDHKNIIAILDNLAIGAYDKVEVFLEVLFSKFENTGAGKHWCVWFMDCLEQHFEKYLFTGHYQNAVKNCQSERIDDLKGIFFQYMKKVFQTFEEKKLSTSGQLIEKTKTLINENFSNKNFSLTAASDHLQISYGYLSGIFRQETGESFSGYLIKARMQKAAELIKKRELKIYEVAESCGYGNYRYFSDSFRKYWGMTPSEYQTVEQ